MTVEPFSRRNVVMVCFWSMVSIALAVAIVWALAIAMFTWRWSAVVYP